MARNGNRDGGELRGTYKKKGTFEEVSILLEAVYENPTAFIIWLPHARNAGSASKSRVVVLRFAGELYNTLIDVFHHTSG